MVIVAGNGYDDQNSNPGRECILHNANNFWKDIKAIILPAISK